LTLDNKFFALIFYVKRHNTPEDAKLKYQKFVEDVLDKKYVGPLHALKAKEDQQLKKVISRLEVILDDVRC